MTLENLLGISLDKIEPNRQTVAQLLAAAERNLKDAQLDALSPENRFDAAYKAIMQLCMLALQARGIVVTCCRGPNRLWVADSEETADRKEDRARQGVAARTGRSWTADWLAQAPTPIYIDRRTCLPRPRNGRRPAPSAF